MNVALRPIPDEKFSELTRSELIIIAKGEQHIRLQMQSELESVRALNKELKDRTTELEGKFVTIKNKLFSPSSEKAPKPPQAKPKGKKRPQPSPRLPSERYPNVPVVEKELALEQLPTCGTCGTEMLDSGMSEDSEYLTVIPKRYLIIRQKRRKYRCGCCHSNVQTTPSLPRIKAGSSYSDEMTVDVSLSKYCDLIPMERYTAMAARQGVRGLPANSLIEATHNLADFLTPAVKKVRQEVLNQKVLQADETPHRMLEGDKKSNWFLWGFSGPSASYFECHNSRSGDVAKNFLAESKCEKLVSDVYAGYKKAVREANLIREEKSQPIIKNAYCNAHARRKFKDAEHVFPKEAAFYLKKYQQIYKLESEAKGKPESEVIKLRKQMAPYFESILSEGKKNLETISTKSSLATAIKYFAKHFTELTQFQSDADVPIDNNAQERILRSPVIGRKTWYGTHSKRGAETAAKLFSLVESCKLNNVNPRKYFQLLVKNLHRGKEPFTPKELKEREKT